MKNIFPLIVVLFLCSFIISCKKDSKGSDPLPPVLAHDSMTRLSKYIFIDAQVSLSDTVAYYEYLYDSLQRVVKANWFEYVNSSPVLATTITYYYSNSDSMAYKSIFTSTDPLYPEIQTTFYSYDNLLRLIKDSTELDSSLTVHNYQYSNTMAVAIGKFTFSNPALHSYVQVDTTFIESTGDVITAHQWDSDNNGQYYIDSFTYDSKPNPFYQLNIRSTYRPIPKVQRYQNYILQEHNLIMASTTDPVYSTVPTRITYKYTYDPSGLPYIEDIADLTPFYRARIVFIYKKI